MSDQNAPDVPPTPTPATSPTGSAGTAAGGRMRWRERVLGWRGVAAVAVAGIVLGGAGGAVLDAVSSGADGDRSGPAGQHGFGGPRQGRPPMMGGQLPPSTPPQDRSQS